MKRIIAALSFFTRLPFWRLTTLDKSHYERVTPLWPLVGWLTGGIMALVFWLSTMVFPLTVCVILTIVIRVLITGALHEDGFADFCDGFGGGTTRERTLEIMKDSHIGTYGVLGLILYYLLFYHVLIFLASSFTVGITCGILVIMDTLSKYLSSTIVYYLPYARNEEQAKNRLVYSATPPSEKIMSALIGIMPLVLFVFIIQQLPLYGRGQGGGLSLMLFLPIIGYAITTALFRKMKSRIGGYTGDCCGASFIITECLLYLSLLIIICH